MDLRKRLSEEYERTARDRHRPYPPFDELVLLYSNPAMTTIEAGRRLGVTRSSASELYKRYLAPLLGPWGQRRRRERTELKRQAALLMQDEHPRLEPIMDAAGQAGLEFRTFLHDSGRGDPRLVRTTVIQIGSALCRLHTCVRGCRPHPSSTRRYGHFRITADDVTRYAVNIFRLAIPRHPERIFIVPSAVLADVAPRRVPYVYIPAQDRPVYRNCKPSIDWKQYENAWHLLGGTCDA